MTAQVAHLRRSPAELKALVAEAQRRSSAWNADDVAAAYEHREYARALREIMAYADRINAAFDAAQRFPRERILVYKQVNVSPECPAAKVLLGKLQPPDCPHFGGRCTPDHPLGAPMVSPEGPCAAFYLHRRFP